MSTRFTVESLFCKFDIELKRKVTIIRGYSGTGKTSLFKCIESSRKNNNNVSVKSDLPVATVIDMDHNDSFISFSNNRIYIIDEDSILLDKDNLQYLSNEISKSNSYFIIISRSDTLDLVYSVYSIMRLFSERRDNSQYYTLVPFYSENTFDINNELEGIITEDNNINGSRVVFFKDFCNIPTIGSSGNKSIYSMLLKNRNYLGIIDAEAYGAFISKVINDSRINYWLPRSFEYLLLNASEFEYVPAEDFEDICKFLTFERYYTYVIEECSKKAKTYYDKADLTNYFNKVHIINNMYKSFPEPAKKLFDSYKNAFNYLKDYFKKYNLNIHEYESELQRLKEVYGTDNLVKLVLLMKEDS